MKQLLLVFLLATLFSCQQQNKKPINLYSQLGGHNKIELFVDNLVDLLLEDKRINFLFEETNKQDFSALLVAQICYETGGQCEYKGLTMLEAHSGMNINKREFDNFVEDFILAMEASQIPLKQQNKLLKIFAPMRGEVIHQ